MRRKLLSTVCCLFICVVVSPLTAQEWQSLFDGESTSGWVTQKGDPVPNMGWMIDDGMLHLDRSQRRGGNIFSEREYGDFELYWEWKVAEKANNGLKYRVRDYNGQMLGLEYQMIDDYNNPGLKEKHKTASMYDLYEPYSSNLLMPHGEFNHSRVVVQNNRMEHWLNGTLVMTACVGSPDWFARVASSKFNKKPGFGQNQVGKLMLTDHGDKVWYRKIFIRELPSCPASCAPPLVSIPRCCTHQQVCVASNIKTVTSLGLLTGWIAPQQVVSVAPQQTSVCGVCADPNCTCRSRRKHRCKIRRR